MLNNWNGSPGIIYDKLSKNVSHKFSIVTEEPKCLFIIKKKKNSTIKYGFAYRKLN